MRLDTRSRVAIAAILDVAVHGAGKPVSIVGISVRQRVSVSYLEQLFKKLRENGFLRSYRGVTGGYRLIRQLSAISVADIVDAVDDKAVDRNPRSGNGRRDETVACITNGLWRKANEQLHDYLRSVSLESVLADARSAALRKMEVVPVPTFGVASAPIRREKRSLAAVA